MDDVGNAKPIMICIFLEPLLQFSKDFLGADEHLNAMHVSSEGREAEASLPHFRMDLKKQRVGVGEEKKERQMPAGMKNSQKATVLKCTYTTISICESLT